VGRLYPAEVLIGDLKGYIMLSPPQDSDVTIYRKHALLEHRCIIITRIHNMHKCHFVIEITLYLHKNRNIRKYQLSVQYARFVLKELLAIKADEYNFKLNQ